ncbi:MAG: C69 family dipeptidase [Bacteroidia bacterium]|nr:C69 family dipeptidase [Bacteroidia bacterium]
MCDTFIHRSGSSTIFAKNSDREPNEAQEVLHIPRTKNRDNTLQCTYIEIPQVPYSNEVILSKPFQMWGAEMGINEHGVVIGNEAVFSKIKEPRKNLGLTGMDMIRIALERSSTAENAVTLICNLLETYGQDACGGYHDTRFYYHNSFIIADAHIAFKLESAGRHWVYQSIKKYDSISNGFTIETDYDNISANAIDFAMDKKWIARGKDFSFAKAFGRKLMTHLSRAKIRRACTALYMVTNADFGVSNAIESLQQHFDLENFEPARSTARNICMHPTGPLNPSQTNGSMIVKLKPNEKPGIWLTGTSMPCLSVYKPIELGQPIDMGSPPSEKLDDSLWWLAEKVHRHICLDYSNNLPLHQQLFDGMQDQIFEGKIDPESIWNTYRDKLNALESLLRSSGQHLSSRNPIYRYRLKKRNKAVGIHF